MDGWIESRKGKEKKAKNKTNDFTISHEDS